MADPDAPSPRSPTKRYWLHWLVTNIQGEDLIANGIKQGQKHPPVTVEGYEGPSPPRGTGYHRYYFYLFEQDGPLRGINAPDQRGEFDVAKFAKENGLNPNPAALNMFETRRDG